MAVKNSLVKAAKKQTFSNFLAQDAIKKKVNEMIGGKSGQRFITSIISAVSVNPALANCEHASILSAAMLGESLKLSPSPQLGHYYMLPYKKKSGEKDDKGRDIYISQAQFTMGYKGYLQLAMRSGYYKKINVLALKEGELKSFDPLNEIIEAVIIEDIDDREAAPTIGYYAMFEYLNGFTKAMYWSKKKMMIHADTYSPAFNAGIYQKILNEEIPVKDMWKYSSFWYKRFDDMSFKTMLRQLISKWGIMSIDLQSAFERDDTLLNEDGTFDYIDNEPENEPADIPSDVPTIDAEVVEQGGQAEQEDDAMNALFGNE